MASAGSLFVKLGIDTKEFNNGLKYSENKLKRFGDRLGSLGSRITTGLSIPLAVVSGAAIKFGMDAVESENLFSVSMGKMADSARTWSENLREQLGLNAYEVRKNVGVFNTMLDSMGLSENAAYDMSKGLTQLAYDMASFYNLKTDEAFTKLQSGISGEVEPLKRLGIIVNETTIKNWALTNGVIQQGEELSETQKVMARYAVIMEQTKKAQGDLGRTLDSPTNKLRIMQERFKQVATDLGVALLPAFTNFLNAMKPFVDIITKLVQWFNNLSEPIRNAITVVTGITVALGPLLLIASKITTAFSALIGVMRLLPSLGLITFFTNYTTAISAAAAGSQAAASSLAFMNGTILQSVAAISGLIAVAWSLKSAFDSFKDLKVAIMSTEDIKKITDLNKAYQVQVSLKKEISRIDSEIQKMETGGGLYGVKRKLGLNDEDLKLYKQRLTKLKELQTALNKQIESLTKIDLPDIELPKIDLSEIIGDGSKAVLTADEIAEARQSLTDKIKSMTLGEVDYQKWALDQEKADFLKTYADNQELLDQFTAYYNLKLNEIVKSADTWAQQTKQIVADTSQAMEQNLGSGFFDIAKGDFDSLGDYLEDFFDSILQSWSNLIAKMAAQKIMGSSLGTWFSSLLSSGTISGSSSTTGTLLKGKASGGSVSSGQTYLVGEKGPELFTAGASGTITPNNAIGGGNLTIKSINVINNTGTKATSKVTTQTDPDGYIVNVVLNALNTNKGGLRDAVVG